MKQHLTPFGANLKQSFDYIRSNSKIIFPVSIIYFLILISNQIFALTAGTKIPIPYLIFAFALGILTTWLNTVIINTFQKRETDLIKALKIPRELYIRNIVVGLLFSLILFGGYFLFIIPGLIFAVWFKFILWESTFHGKSGLKAFVFSRERTKGFFWPMLGRILILSIPFYIAFGIQFYFILFLKSFNFQTQLVWAFVWALFLGFYYPFLTVFWGFVYKEVSKVNVLPEKIEISGKRYLFVGILGLIVGPIIIVTLVVLMFLAIISADDINKSFLNSTLAIGRYEKLKFVLNNHYKLFGKYPDKLENVDNVVDESNYTYVIKKEGKDFKLCIVENKQQFCYDRNGEIGAVNTN